MNINTTPHVLVRHGWQRDLVYRVLHDRDEAVFFRPAVGDFLYQVPEDYRLERIYLHSLPKGPSTVCIRHADQETQYRKIDAEIAVFVGQHFQYLNMDSVVYLQRTPLDKYMKKIIVQNSPAFISVIGEVARQGFIPPDQYVIDDALVEHIHRALDLRYGGIERGVNTGS